MLCIIFVIRDKPHTVDTMILSHDHDWSARDELFRVCNKSNDAVWTTDYYIEASLCRPRKFMWCEPIFACVML